MILLQSLLCLLSAYEKVASDYLIRIEILGSVLETATLHGSR